MGWLWFICVQIIATIAMIIGWALLIPFAVFKWWKQTASVHFPDRRIQVWSVKAVNAVWGNDEDGVLGPTWYNPLGTPWRAYLWSAWRNSANNLRWVFANKGGPYYKWVSTTGKWYFQAGFRPDTGWPVLSAGKV